MGEFDGATPSHYGGFGGYNPPSGVSEGMDSLGLATRLVRVPAAGKKILKNAISESKSIQNLSYHYFATIYYLHLLLVYIDS